MKNKWNTLRLSWFPSYSATPSVTPSDLFWARALSCTTSITGSKMNELGLVSVLCLLFAKAAGAPKHWEHLQTESNEAAGHIAAHSSCTNQSCWPLKGPRRTATSYRKLHSYLLKSLLASRKWSSVASFRAHSNRNTDWLAKLWQSLVAKEKSAFPDCLLEVAGSCRLKRGIWCSPKTTLWLFWSVSDCCGIHSLYEKLWILSNYSPSGNKA